MGTWAKCKAYVLTNFVDVSNLIALTRLACNPHRDYKLSHLDFPESRNMV